ncbi:MAG: hypothetical protein LBR99_01990, partial [Treponema sp.]|nr:hypothetical protein [Treponema sp.]
MKTYGVVYTFVRRIYDVLSPLCAGFRLPGADTADLYKTTGKSPRGPAAFLLVGLISLAALAGCPMDVLEDFIALRSEPIVNYDLQAYIPIPTTGAVPVKTVSSRKDMDITVIWMDGTDESGTDITESLELFEDGKIYRADITLTAKTGWVFDPNTLFAYPSEADTEQLTADDGTASDVRVLRVTYNPTEAPQFVVGENLAQRIPAPVIGGTPVRSLSGAAYSGTVEWRVLPADSAMTAGLFQSDTQYKAVVSLYPAPGYVFSPEQSGGFSYSGSGVSSITTHGTPVNGTMTGNIPVSDLDLTLKVPRPVNGGVPVTTVFGPQYSAGTT